jgi:hypothetical protein
MDQEYREGKRRGVAESLVGTYRAVYRRVKNGEPSRLVERRFSFAVDYGRLPENHIKAARTWDTHDSIAPADATFNSVIFPGLKRSTSGLLVASPLKKWVKVGYEW